MEVKLSVLDVRETALTAYFFLGLLASGILKIDGIGRVHTWQQIFLIEGILTCVVGIGAYVFMTDRIETAKWLTPEEKDLANARIKSEQAGVTVVLDKVNKRSIFQGILAPSTLPIAFVFLLNNITVQGLAFFTPTIVRSIFPKKSTVTQQLFTVPPYLVGACVTLLVCLVRSHTLFLKYSQRAPSLFPQFSSRISR